MNKSTRCLLSLFLVVCMTLSLFTGAFATTEATPEVTAITEKTATLVTNTAALKAGDQIIIAALNFFAPAKVRLKVKHNTRLAFVFCKKQPFHMLLYFRIGKMQNV